MRHIRSIAALLALLMSFHSAAAAGEIFVTDIKTEKGAAGLAELTINGVLHIREIEPVKAVDRTVLKFPRHVSRKKRVYPLVRPVTRQASDELRRAVESGKPAAAKTGVNACRISRFTALKGARRSGLKAFVLVSFNDAVEVECRILETANGPCILWPSRKVRGREKYVDLVWISDKRLKEEIEALILERYHGTFDRPGDGDAEMSAPGKPGYR